MPAPFVTLGTLLSQHQAVTRVAVAALILTVVFAFSQQTPLQAGPQATPPTPPSLLPQPIGIAIGTDEAVRVTFEQPMNASSVADALEIAPTGEVDLTWNESGTELTVAPESLWRTDSSYVIVVGESAQTESGESLDDARRYSFSTQTAPSISGFEVQLAAQDLPVAEAPTVEATAFDPMAIEQEAADEVVLSTVETAREVSASSSVRIRFSATMNRPSVQDAFRIAPEVAGELSWSEGDLIFTPTERLAPGGRYTISLMGARDRAGNELGGKANFSFVVRAGPQLVRTTPELDATDVEPATVEMWFSHAMDVDATNAAFSLVDTTTGRPVAGRLNWNEEATQLVYSPDRPLVGERTFEVVLGDGAADTNGAPIRATWSFTTAPGAPPPPPAATAAPTARGAAAPAAPRPAVAFVPGPASGLEGYGLNQINAARAAYGFPPLVLDPAISAVASAHAWDQLNRGYYSHHTAGSGASVQQRLAAAGIGFSAAGENQCHASMGLGAQGTMNWCHGVFMAEPWPGHWNHIGNILSTRYTRVGIGVADNGSRVVITWDFAN